MQFSVFDLNMQSLNLTKDDGSGTPVTQLVDGDSEPDNLAMLLDDNVTLTELLYDLNAATGITPSFRPGF
jgi:hypothetical protein